MNDYVKIRLNNLGQANPGISGGNNLEKTDTNSDKTPDKSELLINYSNPAYNQLAINRNSFPDNSAMLLKVANSADKQGKQLLQHLLKEGKLLSTDANDGTSTLQNLYKLVTIQRLSFFNSQKILKETLKTLANPYIITQTYGKIPDAQIPALTVRENERLKREKEQGLINPDKETDIYPVTKKDIDFSKGHTCPAASIEFNLADKKPAEFVRYVEALTGQERCVKSKIKFKDVSTNLMEALGALIDQKATFKALDWENLEITLKPDDNAYIRAKAQQDNRVKDSKSMIDELFQSTFMCLGSGLTYNSLTDRRSKDTGGGRGLNQSEIAFVESIVDNSGGKAPVVYMELDDNITKVTGYAYDFKTTEKQLVDSLKMGKNVITGFIPNENGKIPYPDGHEILLTGFLYDKKGQLWFKYNDTDDGDHYEPSYIKSSDFIPTVHHANLPRQVMGSEVQEIDSGYVYLKEYNNMLNQKKNETAAV